MKPNAIPPQTPPLVEPCPWCAGDLDIGESSVACAACDVEVDLATRLAATAAAA